MPDMCGMEDVSTILVILSLWLLWSGLRNTWMRKHTWRMSWISWVFTLRKGVSCWLKVCAFPHVFFIQLVEMEPESIVGDSVSLFSYMRLPDLTAPHGDLSTHRWTAQYRPSTHTKKWEANYSRCLGYKLFMGLPDVVLHLYLSICLLYAAFFFPSCSPALCACICFAWRNCDA